MASLKKATWTDIKTRIKNWDRPELIGLVHDLFDLDPENKQFLIAKIMSAPDRKIGEIDNESPEAKTATNEAILAPFKKRIQIAFYGRGKFPGKLNLADGRKAIRDYRKAVGDLCGTIDLMLHYVETGTRFTLQYGDIDSAYYDSLISVLFEIERTLQTNEGRQHYPRFSDRLTHLGTSTYGRIGWGYADYIENMVYSIEQWMKEHP